ncbi:hypothetical protein Tco_0455487 [Tanacetum coccineum]
MKLATKRSQIETHGSHASGSGADEGTGSIPGVPDVPTYGSDDEQISWKSSDEEDDDEVTLNDDNDDDDDDNDDDGNNDDDDDDADNRVAENQDDDDEQTNSDNDGDDFVHPKFSTHDEEDKEEDSFDPRGDKTNEEETNEEAEVDALYRDVNVNLEGRDSKMTDAPRIIVQTTQVIEDTHVIITLVNPEVDVLVTTFAEPPLLSATTLPPPPTPVITHLQQTPVPTPPTVPSSSLQDLLNFGSLFEFDHRLKTLENNFLEFNQMNQFTTAVSLILGIVDAYLANKMHEAVKIAVQLQSERLKDEAQAENADFLNKLDDNIKKIIKDQVKDKLNLKSLKFCRKLRRLSMNNSKLRF